MRSSLLVSALRGVSASKRKPGVKPRFVCRSAREANLIEKKNSGWTAISDFITFTEREAIAEVSLIYLI